jgi:hypothetical protein
MKTIQEAELKLISGGEVGATHMGDDYHYTGNGGGNDYGSATAECYGAFGGIDGGSAAACLWIMWDYISH